MGEAKRHDTWAGGGAYESFMGRWSRLVANEFLEWIEQPQMGRWLDVGCGTGAMSQAVFDLASPGDVCGIDPSVGFVEYALNHVADTRAHFHVGDARALPYTNDAFDSVVSGLALNFVPGPRLAVAEMRRVARPGGTVSVYVWDYAGEMQILRHFWDAVTALDPAAGDLDEGPRFEICNPAVLEGLFGGGGMRDVSVRAIDINAHFADFEEYWCPFLGGQGPAPGYVASLSDDARASLRERLQASLPVSADGSIDLIARAWAIRGTA